MVHQNFFFQGNQSLEKKNDLPKITQPEDGREESNCSFLFPNALYLTLSFISYCKTQWYFPFIYHTHAALAIYGTFIIVLSTILSLLHALLKF